LPNLVLMASLPRPCHSDRQSRERQYCPSSLTLDCSTLSFTKSFMAQFQNGFDEIGKNRSAADFDVDERLHARLDKVAVTSGFELTLRRLDDHFEVLMTGLIGPAISSDMLDCPFQTTIAEIVEG